MRKSVYLSTFAIWAAMLFFCALSPFSTDDFGRGAGSSNLADMFAVQLNEYFHWSGKFVGQFLTRAVLHSPAWVFPLLGASIFTVLVLAGVALTFGREWRSRLRAWHVLVLAGLAWFAIPGFGTAFFWRTGSLDYGIGLMWVTLFLVPYRVWLEDRTFRIACVPLFACLALLAGWSNENVGMLAILLALSVLLIRLRTGIRPPLWAVAGIAGAVCGWIFMMAAPGNAERLAYLGGQAAIPLLSAKAFGKFLVFYGTQQLELAPLTVSTLALVWCLWRRGHIVDALPGIVFFLMSQASLCAFLLSPSTPMRAMTGTYFYAALALFALFCIVNASPSKAGRVVIVVFCLLFCASVGHEMRMFVAAQPAIAARNQANAESRLSLEHFVYPASDKYFFPMYDLKEAWYMGPKLPWERAQTVRVGKRTLRVLLVPNMVYLDGLPPDASVMAAGAGYGQTVSFQLQWLARKLFPLEDAATTATGDITLRYMTSRGQTLKTPGQIMIHLRGIERLDDLAYVAVREPGDALVWEKVVPVTQ